MVDIINLSGLAFAAVSNINLDTLGYSQGPIAKLVGVQVKRLGGAAFTPTLAGHIHAITLDGHRHPLYIEISTPAAALGLSTVLGVSAGSGLLAVQTPGATSLPTAIATTVSTGTISAALDTIGTVPSVVISNKWVANNGLLSAGATAAALSAVLSGRQQINLGDAVFAYDEVIVRVMYASKFGGVF